LITSFYEAVKNMMTTVSNILPKKDLIMMEGNKILFVLVGNRSKNRSTIILTFYQSPADKRQFGLGLYIVDAILREHDYAWHTSGGAM